MLALSSSTCPFFGSFFFLSYALSPPGGVLDVWGIAWDYNANWKNLSNQGYVSSGLGWPSGTSGLTWIEGNSSAAGG